MTILAYAILVIPLTVGLSWLRRGPATQTIEQRRIDVAERMAGLFAIIAVAFTIGLLSVLS